MVNMEKRAERKRNSRNRRRRMHRAVKIRNTDVEKLRIESRPAELVLTKYLVTLNYEQDTDIHEILFKTKDDDLIHDMAERRTAIHGRDLKSLNWISLDLLTDAIISRYLLLIQQRNSREGMIPVLTHEIFFLQELDRIPTQARRDRGNRNKTCIFNHKYVFLPKLQKGHYTLFVINMELRKIECLNSMRHSQYDEGNHKTLKTLENYLRNEEELWSREHDWTLSIPWVPQQQNMRDCGVFICTYAELYSREAPFNFSQRDISHIRRRIAFEIYNNKLLDVNKNLTFREKI